MYLHHLYLENQPLSLPRPLSSLNLKTPTTFDMLKVSSLLVSTETSGSWEFPGPVVGSPCFHYLGEHGYSPGGGDKILHAEWHSQKRKDKKNFW